MKCGGGGVQSSTRSCTSPKPRFKGKPCEGPTKRTQACGQKPCAGENRVRKASKMRGCYYASIMKAINVIFLLFSVTCWRYKDKLNLKAQLQQNH